ncbi:MAG: hypothetical protein IKN42_00435 [Elusimicrobia bacterium]|nr:hypothetical protein [Elusimicrobiota bacterium]
MKLLNCSITRIIVALMFVFSIAGNVLAFYHKEDNWLVCDYCGAKHINSFPRDGHYAWCKYAPAQSSSSGKSSTVYVPKSNSSDLDSAILGTALIGLFSSTPVKTKTPQEIANEQKKQAEIKEKKDLDLLEKQEISRDEQFWQSGDYIVKEGNLKYYGDKAFGIYNTKTQKWVLNADKQKDNTGRIAIFRKVKKKKDGLWKREDGWWNFGRIRLLNCNDKNSTYNKPLVWMYNVREYRPEEKKWKWKFIKDKGFFAEKFFMINDNDELEEIKPLNREFYKKVFLLNKNGKYGVALIDADHLLIPKKALIYRYHGYTITIPIEYDSVKVFNNLDVSFARIAIATVVYKAKKQDNVYMFGFYGERLSPKFLEYDSITCVPDVMEDFYIVSKNRKFGAVNGAGNIIVPLIYDKATGPYYAVRDIFPDVSFSYWYKNKVKPYLTQKGKYEKEADYEERMKDRAKQQQYILEQTKNADKEYIEAFKDKIILSLGKYDTEKEIFNIRENIKIVKNNKEVIGELNVMELSVPIKEAEAFEKNFKNIVQDALKNATYGICYDKIAIAKITFKMPNGKTYTFDSTKAGK